LRSQSLFLNLNRVTVGTWHRIVPRQLRWERVRVEKRHVSPSKRHAQRVRSLCVSLLTSPHVGSASAHTKVLAQGGREAVVLPGLTGTGGAWAGTSRRKFGD
jgi:hypothetical protein